MSVGAVALWVLAVIGGLCLIGFVVLVIGAVVKVVRAQETDLFEDEPEPEDEGYIRWLAERWTRD